VQTHQPEPARLLVTVIKALQSTDPRLGPDNLRQGWRPDQNIDPRIMLSPLWVPIFKPLPREVHQALTASLLTAWMNKNSQYPIALRTITEACCADKAWREPAFALQFSYRIGSYETFALQFERR